MDQLTSGCRWAPGRRCRCRCRSACRSERGACRAAAGAARPMSECCSLFSPCFPAAKGACYPDVLEEAPARLSGPAAVTLTMWPARLSAMTGPEAGFVLVLVTLFGLPAKARRGDDWRDARTHRPRAWSITQFLAGMSGWSARGPRRRQGRRRRARQARRWRCPEWPPRALKERAGQSELWHGRCRSLVRLCRRHGSVVRFRRRERIG